MSAVKRVCYCIVQLMVISTCVVEFAKPQQSDEGAEGQSGESPYMLVSTYNSILRVQHWPYVSTPQEPEELVKDDVIPGFESLAYHYRKGRMYWAVNDPFDPQIKSAYLNGSDVVTIVSDRRFVSRPVDVTVDWINDKLYWADRGKRQINEYDLNTGFTRTVYSTGPASLPSGLVVYPFPNYGWLYWTDNQKETIERVSVIGGDHMIIQNNLVLGCIGPISLEYLTHTLYWIDNCGSRTIRSITISGSQVISNRPIIRPETSGSSQGLTLYKDIVYWTETNRVYGFNVTAGGSAVLVLQGSQRNTFEGVKIVQPLSQPEEEKYIEMILNITAVEAPVCVEGCVNGLCIPPGLCACNKGWTGVTCNRDINECDLENNVCNVTNNETCINVVGSFHCSCNGRSGYVVSENGEDCVDLDECEAFDGICEHNCTNVIGSFNCSCLAGHTLTNGTNCTMIQSTTVLLPSSTTTSVLATQPITPPAPTPLMSSTFELSTSSVTFERSSSSMTFELSTSSMTFELSTTATFGLSTSVTHPLTSSEAPVSTTVSRGPVPILSTSVFSSMLTQSTAQLSNPIPMSSSFIPVSIISIPIPSSTNTPILSTVESSSSALSEVSSSRATTLLLTTSSLPAPTTSTSITVHTQSSSRPAQIVSSQILSSSPRSSTTRISSSVEELYTRASVSTPLRASRSRSSEQLSSTPTPSPEPPASTGGTKVSEREFPMVVVISSAVAGGTALFVAIVLVVVILFGYYIKTRTGSYNFPVEKSSSKLEGGTVRASKIVFQAAPSSLDSQIFGADNKSPISIGNGTSLNGSGTRSIENGTSLNENGTLNGNLNGHLNGNETNLNTSVSSENSSGTIVIT